MRGVLKLSMAFLIGSSLYANSQAVTLEEGWNLKGADCSVNFQNIDNPDVRLVWKYKDGRWEIFTKDEDIKRLAQNLGIETFTTTEPFDGFWILAGAPTTVDLCGEEGGGGYGVPGEDGIPISQEDGIPIPFLRALEGKFDLVLQNLADKPDKTDGEKIAYAVALLGKTAQTGALEDSGLYIIPGYGSVFSLEDTHKRWCNSKQWVDDAKSLIAKIDESLKELGTVSSNISIVIPQSYLEDDVSAVLDGVTVDALKALLKLSKAKLEYLLAYDWSKVGELCASGEDEKVLPYLEVLRVSNSTYLEKAKEDLDTALKELKDIAEQEVPNMSKDNYSKSLFTWFLMDDNGDYPSQDEVRDAGVNTISPLINSLEEGTTSVSNPDATYAKQVNLKYVFENPFDGEQVKNDAESGDVIEVEVCDGGGGYCDLNGNCTNYCYDTAYEVWFKEGSYLYNYIKSVAPDIKLYTRTLNGTTYYTVNENDYWDWNVQKSE